MNIGKRFGRNLTLARRHAGLTQAQLSQRASMPIHSISQLENGHRLPRLGTLLSLAGALEVPAADLLAGIG